MTRLSFVKVVILKSYLLFAIFRVASFVEGSQCLFALHTNIHYPVV